MVLNNGKRFETDTSNYYPNPTTNNSTPEFPYRLRNFESGERKWWMDDDDTVNDINNLENDITKTGDYFSKTNAIHEDKNVTIINGMSDLSVSSGKSDRQKINLAENGSLNKTCPENETLTTDQSNKFLDTIQRIQSGEKPWWLSNSSGNKTSSGEKHTVFHNNEGNKIMDTMWELETQADVSELQKDDDISEINSLKNVAGSSKFPEENNFDLLQSMGIRSPPEGSPGRKSPYDNIPSPINVNQRNGNNFNAVPKMFISRQQILTIF